MKCKKSGVIAKILNLELNNPIHVMRLMFAFGLSFELPVVLLLLVKSGFVTPEGLAAKRRYAILISFVAAAILTPPDVISQVMLATPIIILYEISIIASKIMYKKDKN